MFVDFHAHILPSADHGSENIEMSLSQLRHAADAGVDTIIATPHFYSDVDTIDAFLARREASYKELCSANDTGVTVIKGAEVHFYAGLEDLESLEKLCIEGTDYILIEPPPEPWPYWIPDAFLKIIRERRLRPICAHIDRFSHISRDKIFKLNIDVQMNASAVLETRRSRRYYLDLIADDMIHLLGSDVHGDGRLAYHDFSAAVKKIGKMMPYLTKNARNIISSKPRETTF